MRLRVLLDNPRPVRVPINHQELLAGLVYHLLGTSSTDYSRFLHDEGYRMDGGPKRFKLFVFSNLRVPKSQRRLEGDQMHIARGPVEWLLASPVADFLTHGATGLLTAGNTLRVGGVHFPIRVVESLQTPAFTETTRFTCLTSIVASVPLPGGGTRYLRPCDGDAFSEAVRKNLLAKYRTLHGHPPADERLRLDFDQGYLARNPHGGTKKETFKGIDIIGAMAPFTLTGSPELMELAWNAGLGEKNAGGFGMVDVTKDEMQQ